jgi:hypothetical protein
MVTGKDGGNFGGGRAGTRLLDRQPVMGGLIIEKEAIWRSPPLCD